MSKRVVSVVLAFILSFFLTVKYNLQSLFSILLMIISFFIIEKSIKKFDKKYSKLSIVLSIIFSIIYVICDSMEKSYTLDIFNRFLLLNLSGYFIIFYISFIHLFNYIDKYKKTPKEDRRIYIGNKEILSESRFSFIVNFSLFFIINLLFLLRLYPGNLTYDSFNELSQVLGNLPLMDNHSILHTGIIAIFVKFGLLFKSVNLGVFLYLIFQVTIVSLVFSYLLYFLAKQRVPVIFRIITLFILGFHPINIIYSITMWKDILFSLFFVLFTIQLFYMNNDNEIFNKKKNIIIFMITTILLMYLRNNGPYIVVPSFVILYIIYRKKVNRILPVFLSIIAIFFISKITILKCFNIKGVEVQETLSLPSQSIARIYKNGNITAKEKKQIESFYSSEIGKVYNPIISDNTKNLLNKKYYIKHKKEYRKLNLTLFKKHSKEYLESFISNSYGYYYINTNYPSIMIQDTDIEGVIHKPIIGNLTLYLLFVFIITVIMIVVLWNLEEKVNILIPLFLIPVLFAVSKDNAIIQVFLNIGIYVTTCFIMFVYNLKNKRNVSYYIPIIISWMIILLSPVYSEFRYLYSLFLLAPILVGLTFRKDA